MDSNFKKFKNKVLRHAVIESVVAGAAAALVVAAVLLFAFTASVGSANALVVSLSAVGAFVLCGGITFVFRRPTDKKVAKRLDKELSFNEKVQTMVEFSSSQDSMVQIQREDASNRLAAAGTGTIKFKRVWQCAVAGLVAVGLFAGGLCYNLLHYVPPVFADTTNWQVQRLLDLKSSVDRNVYFTADTKEVINGELDSILEIIYNEETGEVLSVERSVLVSAVTGSMVVIDTAVENDIDVEEYGVALSEATADETFRAMAFHIASLKTSTMLTEFSNIKYKFVAEIAAASVRSYSSIMRQAVTAADPDHEITGYFVALCDSLDAIASAGGEGATIVNLARSAVDAASASVNVVVSAAAEARSSGREIIYDLQDIFDITDEEMPGLHEPVEDLNSSSEEGGNTGGDGGAGRDETVYAGDSEIYWASRGEYVKYGEALDGEYFANYTGYEGEISDELRNFIEAYFNSLRNGD